MSLSHWKVGSKDKTYRRKHEEKGFCGAERRNVAYRIQCFFYPWIKYGKNRIRDKHSRSATMDCKYFLPKRGPMSLLSASVHLSSHSSSRKDSSSLASSSSLNTSHSTLRRRKAVFRIRVRIRIRNFLASWIPIRNFCTDPYLGLDPSINKQKN